MEWFKILYVTILVVGCFYSIVKYNSVKVSLNDGFARANKEIYEWYITTWTLCLCSTVLCVIFFWPRVLTLFLFGLWFVVFALLWPHFYQKSKSYKSRNDMDWFDHGIEVSTSTGHVEKRRLIYMMKLKKRWAWHSVLIVLFSASSTLAVI